MQTFQGVELRPYARQGKAYFIELRDILHKEGTAIYHDAQDFIQREDGKITVRLVGALAIKHRLNFKATIEYLEKRRLLKAGVYGRLKDRGLRPSDALQRGYVWLQELGKL